MIQDLFPPSARGNRIVPKRTFIDKLGANARMKEHFTRDVVSIEWFAKLAPYTLNMTDGLDVHEIAVFPDFVTFLIVKIVIPDIQ